MRIGNIDITGFIKKLGALLNLSHLEGSLDDISDGTTYKKISDTEKSKLAGIEENSVSLPTVKADSDIADTISKKHEKNKDTKLDNEGNNEVSASELVKSLYNVILNAFRIAVDGSLIKHNMVDGIIDEFEDESGIDTEASANEYYNENDNYYRPDLFLEMDYMEYPTDALAQAEYISSDTDPVTLISHTTSNGDGTIGNSTGVERRQAQSIELSETHKIRGLSIEFGASGGEPIGDVTFRIETNSGGLPSGNLANVNATKAITPVASQWNNVMFDTPFDLIAGIYWIVSVCDNQANNKFWIWRMDGEGTYLGGCRAASADGGSSWSTYTSWDMSFKVYSDYPLQCYSESSIKIQGTYSLRVEAWQGCSLNDTLTRTLVGADKVDLSNIDTLKFYIKASRTGQNIQLQIHDSGGTTTTKDINISSDTWEQINWDISEVPNVDKDDIDQILIKITDENSTNIIYIDKFEYFGTPPNMTLISQAAIAEAQPNISRIVLFEEDIDSIIINTDLKAYVSRDGGTTWTEVTLVDEGDYESNKRILIGMIDISGQPAGTSMLWKVETLNNKDLKIYGISLLWD